MGPLREKPRVTINVADKSSNPIIVSFPGGLPESIENRNIEPARFLWQKSDVNTKRGRRVVGYDRHCLYSATTRGLLFDDRRTKLCVGIYDKKRRSIVLHEGATNGTIFSLKQSVPTYTERNGKVETDPSSNADRPNIFEDFGSQKKRRVLKSQAANRVDVDHVIGAGTDSAIVSQIISGKSMSQSNKQAIEDSKQADTERKTAIDLAIEEARNKLIPQYDMSANDPIGIYSARGIAGEKAWNRIHRKVTACLHQDNPIDEVVRSVFENDWYEFALQRIKGVSPDAKNSAFRITCAIIVNWMVKFYLIYKGRRAIPAIDEEKGTHFGIPIEIATRCFDLFATELMPKNHSERKNNPGYVMTKQNRDKMVIHILLLFMLSSGPSMKIMDIGSIAEVLKVPLGDCRALLKYAGCSISRKGNKLSATLNTPLTFPKAGVNRNRNQR
mmetsp:Transcript_3022/g.8223  ORF Transcript_3022/g.8223 Transcript_3022/m.8223 type:complete len:443 (+) Transcript_3022:122-1450(+)|eukprot:CAMPEP_0197189824 /NCGR_PEP_ID=MMETSP1423-20130617/20445_1 /TAXON_ID=476441 /ORGANISM="Pseudo-nitzschia heimii, Strain UNC1101" /LENGTH=442 /DNA_ID=CAMNT_0042642045 /DNA_START=87 /DNA_END=1415 /DNA_ORIENTATION=-